MNNIINKMYQYAKWLEENILKYEIEKNLNLTNEDLEQINRELNESNTRELES